VTLMRASALVVTAEEAMPQLSRAVRAGMTAWGAPEPLTLDEWAREHFYLSAESSYVEQQWTPWPFQRAIMACISNDDVEEVDLRKSARVGYTKIILAAIAYNAEHRRRNQCIWQPTDDDADDFARSEVDTMLRDVEVMRTVFPKYLSRHKDNKLTQKRFLGSTLRIRGGKAAKNYRRISVDCAYIDEADAFDRDVEKEGDPATLARKRLEGATFPKFVVGSTPKQRGFSLIDDRCALADESFTFQIACPHCKGRHALSWGGRDEPHGFKFDQADTSTTRHLCPHCACDIAQADYLAIAEDGVWINTTGTLWLHHDGRFTLPDGTPAPTPRHVALHVWTAYSPVVAWSSIVDEFLAAHAKMLEGDDTKMKAWVNTTRGESWEGEVERTDADDLKARAEPFRLKVMPRDCLLALCAIDTQDSWLDVNVWGLGFGGEMWSLEHYKIFGNPATPQLWDEAEAWLRTTRYEHMCGEPQSIYATAIDSGGHHTDAVYAFAHKLRSLRVHAIKGTSAREKSIEHGNTKVGFKWNGRVEKNGPTLWHVGTNLAKDRFQARLEVTTPGPGFVHLSESLSNEWFKQLAGEQRATRRMQFGTETRWSPTRKRTEVKDCVAYVIWLEERLDLLRSSRAKFWEQLRAQLQPKEDLFTSLAGPRAANPEVLRQPAASRPPVLAEELGSSSWSSRL
jgi:terminase, large subunit